MTRRHPLDFSPPRLSDLSPDDARQAMLDRARHTRESWLRTRQPRPLAIRFMNLIRGAPPALGRGDDGHPLPSVVATDCKVIG
jgi:hypothetical protein